MKNRIKNSWPGLFLAIISPVLSAQLVVTDDIFGVPVFQVLEVEIGGDREDMVEIIVDPLLMESYGLDQNDIFNLVERNNRLVPAGTMHTGKGRFAIKVPSGQKSPSATRRSRTQPASSS